MCFNVVVFAVEVVGLAVVVLETTCVVASFVVVLIVEVIGAFDGSLSVVLDCFVTALLVVSDCASVTDFAVVGFTIAVVFDVSDVVLGESAVVVFFVFAASVVVFALVVAFSFRTSGELVVLAISDFVVVLISAM